MITLNEWPLVIGNLALAIGSLVSFIYMMKHKP